MFPVVPALRMATRSKIAPKERVVALPGEDRDAVPLDDRRLGRPLVVLQAGRDDDLVDQRVAEAGHLRPAAVHDTVDRDVLAVGRRPDADHVRVGVHLRDRDLQGDRVDVVAGQEVLATAQVARRPGLADGDQVEDGADVGEERIVTLAGEDRDAAAVDDRLLGRLLVVLDADEPVEARADVVDGRRPSRRT